MGKNVKDGTPRWTPYARIEVDSEGSSDGGYVPKIGLSMRVIWTRVVAMVGGKTTDRRSFVNDVK